MTTPESSTHLEKVLIDLGLTHVEAKLYLTLLSMGPSSVLSLSKKSGIKRTTAYDRLESLIQKGLVNIQSEGSRRRFAAENPERLETLLEKRRSSLHDVLPLLSSQYYQIRESESFIKHYYGIEGIKAVYNQFLSELRRGDFYFAISNQAKLFSLAPEFFENFSESRRQVDLDFRLILQDTEHARTYRKSDRLSKKIMKFLPKGMEINTCVITLPKKNIIIQLVQTPSAMVIENPHVIHTNKLMFEMVWGILPEPVPNELE